MNIFTSYSIFIAGYNFLVLDTAKDVGNMPQAQKK